MQAEILNLFRQYGLLLATLTTLLLVLILFSVTSYRHTLAQAAAQTQSLAELIASRIDSDLARVDGILDYLTAELPPQQFIQHPPEEWEALRQRLARLGNEFALINGINLFDRHGTLLLSSLTEQPFTIADRPHFQQLRDQPQLTSIFSSVLVARSSGRWSIVRLYAVRDEAGELAGVISAVLDLETFLHYMAMGNGAVAGGTLQLRSRQEHQLLLQWPEIPASALGQPLPAAHPIPQRLASGERFGVFSEYSDDAKERIGSFRLLERGPLYIQVALTKEQQLLRWRQQSWLVWLGAAVVLMLLALILFYLRRNLQQSREIAAQLTYRQALFRALFDQSPLLIGILDHRARLLEVNQRALAVIGVEREAVVGRYFPDTAWWSQPEQREALVEALRAAYEGQSITLEVSHLTTEQQEIRVLLQSNPVTIHNTLYLAVTGIEITPLKQAQAALARSEAHYRLAQEATGVGIWDWEIEADCIHWDRACWVMLGYPDQERPPLSLETFWALLHPEDIPAIQPIVIQGVTQGRRFVIEFRLRTVAGGWRWIQGRGQVVAHSDEGQATRMLGTHTDIHDTRMAQQQAEEQFARLRKIAATVPGMVYQYQQWPDGRGIFPYASDGISRIYGVSPAEVAKGDGAVFQATHPEDRQQVAEGIERSARELSYWRDEYRVLRPDGQIAWLEGEAMPEAKEDGSVLWHGHIREVTERKQAELELERLSRRLTAIFNSASEGIFGIDLEGRVQFINRAAAEMLGWSQQQLLGQDPHPLTHHTRADGTPYPADDCPIHQCRNDGESREVSDELFWRQDGSSFPVEYVTTPISDHEGENSGAMVVFRNISERTALLADLARSNSELEQFAYAISHDLRQPLRMVSSYLQLLERQLAKQLTPDTQQMIEYAVDGAKRMDQMLLSLLEYSRVGRKGEPIAPLASREALQEALHFLDPAIQEAQAEVSISGDWPTLQVSRNEFTRLLQNLIGNAVKYRAPGRIPKIQINAIHSSKGWHCTICDNGIGIDPKQAHRLFKVFQRLQSRSHYEGSGVGLAVARKIVEHHGGTIWVESAGSDSGTCFHFLLPKGEDSAGG